jgi:hypothetical protein
MQSHARPLAQSDVEPLWRRFVEVRARKDQDAATRESSWDKHPAVMQQCVRYPSFLLLRLFLRSDYFQNFAAGPGGADI